LVAVTRSGGLLALALLLAHPSTGLRVCDAASAQGQESLRLRITNSVGGAVEASADGGRTWQRLGSVTVPADRVNAASYTAAGWARDSAVAATAVNAIHIKVAANPQTGRPMTLSIVPGGKVVGAANRRRSSAIFTDIPGGGTIFGGGLGPYVNSPVFLERVGGFVSNPRGFGDEPAYAPLPPNYQPHDGDVLLIIRYEPVRLPYDAVFENRAGGSVTVDYGDGPVTVGVVDRPVTGIGRFEGAIYAWPGRIRANHPGVIDVSTAPHGRVGGFQIIPREHAASPEMSYAKTAHAWMIVGPLAPDATGWAGQPPLFSGTILPSYRPDDVTGGYADWVQRLWSRTMLQVRYNDGPWELMPRIAFSDDARVSNAEAAQRGRRRLWLIPSSSRPGRPMTKEAAALADHALEGVTHIRLVFPQMPFPFPSPGDDR